MSLPGENTMRLLREATEGRKPKRIWPIFVAVPLFLCALALLGVYGFERKRQKEISNGREELLAASRKAGEALGSPPDWNQWFRSRVPENHGGPEFAEVMKSIRDSAQHGTVDDGSTWERTSLIALYADLDPKSDWHALQDTAKIPPDLRPIHSFLHESSHWPGELRPLLAYDNLNTLPELGHGVPGVAVLPFLEFDQALNLRLIGLAATQQHQQLAAEAVALLELALRLQRPWGLMDGWCCLAFEQRALRWITYCASLGIFQAEQVEKLLTLKWPETATLLRMMEGDCAAAAQIWATFGNRSWSELDRHLADDNRAYRTGWFSWVSTRRGRRRSYNRPQQVLADRTREVSQAVEWLELARRGQIPLPSDPDISFFAPDEIHTQLQLRGLQIQRLKAALGDLGDGRFQVVSSSDVPRLRLIEDGLNAATLKALHSPAGKELREPLALFKP